MHASRGLRPFLGGCEHGNPESRTPAWTHGPISLFLEFARARALPPSLSLSLSLSPPRALALSPPLALSLSLSLPGSLSLSLFAWLSLSPSLCQPHRFNAATRGCGGGSCSRRSGCKGICCASATDHRLIFRSSNPMSVRMTYRKGLMIITVWVIHETPRKPGV